MCGFQVLYSGNALHCNAMWNSVHCEWGVEITEQGVPGVLVGQDGAFRLYHPVNAQRLVEYGDSAVGLGTVVVVAFVLEHRGVAENSETMGKSAWNEELAVVFFG